MPTGAYRAVRGKEPLLDLTGRCEGWINRWCHRLPGPLQLHRSIHIVEDWMLHIHRLKIIFNQYIGHHGI